MKMITNADKTKIYKRPLCKIKEMKQTKEKYKYEVAISLDKRDIDFGKQIIKKLNPNIQKKSFLYTENQKELVGENAVEKFRNVFRKDSRVVVVIYRPEYGKSFYTKLEKEAIIERYADKQGFDFLLVIPIVKNYEIEWYPPTRIYISPENFTIEEIAKFIEFKISQNDGLIPKITFNSKIEFFNEKIKEKREHRALLENKNSKENAINELNKLFEEVKIQHKKINEINLLSKNSSLGGNSYRIHIVGIDNFSVEFKIIDNETFFKVRNINSQSFRLEVSIKENNTDNIIIEEQYRLNINNEKWGWSKEINMGQEIDDIYKSITLKDFNYYYHLDNYITTEQLVENWFIKLFSIIEKKYKLLYE